MSERNRRNNSPHEIPQEVPEEMLRMPIPVIAPAPVWIAQHRRLFMGSARVQIFSGTQRTPSVSVTN
jgi:hypothetical protein